MVLPKHLLLSLLQKHSKNYYFQFAFNQLLTALVTNSDCNISFLPNKLVLENTIFSSLKGTFFIEEYDVVIEPPIYSLQPITMHVLIRVSKQERKNFIFKSVLPRNHINSGILVKCSCSWNSQKVFLKTTCQICRQYSRQRNKLKKPDVYFLKNLH